MPEEVEMESLEMEEDETCSCTAWYCSCKALLGNRRIYPTYFRTPQYKEYLDGLAKTKDLPPSGAASRRDRFGVNNNGVRAVQKPVVKEEGYENAASTSKPNIEVDDSPNIRGGYNCRNRSRFHKCSVCGKMFGQLSSLQWHEKEHVLESPNQFQCNLCGKAYATQASFERHMKSHPSCCLCKAPVKETEVVTDGSRKLCRKCNAEDGGHRWGPAASRYSRHQSDEHKETGVVQASFRGAKKVFEGCDFCGEIFDTADEFSRHYQLHGKSAKPGAVFECRYCTQAFNSKEDVAEHLSSHNAERPYPCLFCSIRFASFPQREVHESIHSNENYPKCSACGQAFKDQDRLSRHCQVLH